MNGATDRRGGKRIVLVEDNDDTRELLWELLELWGHQVTAVSKGIAGAENIISTRPDVALVDVGLPDIDGFQVARRVRAALGPSEVLLVAVSGYGTEEMKRRAAASGFHRHLTKPPALSALAALLEGSPRSAV
jgi:CheY-like chemotaxis protein